MKKTLLLSMNWKIGVIIALILINLLLIFGEDLLRFAINYKRSERQKETWNKRIESYQNDTIPEMRRNDY